MGMLDEVRKIFGGHTEEEKEVLKEQSEALTQRNENTDKVSDTFDLPEWLVMPFVTNDPNNPIGGLPFDPTELKNSVPVLLLVFLLIIAIFGRK